MSDPTTTKEALVERLREYIEASEKREPSSLLYGFMPQMPVEFGRALLAALSSQTPPAAADQGETNNQELHEIADGAYGDGPRVRGLARDRLQPALTDQGVAIAEGEVEVAIDPSPNFYVRLTDDGQYIRKWDRKPFDGATAYVLASLVTQPFIPSGRTPMALRQPDPVDFTPEETIEQLRLGPSASREADDCLMARAADLIAAYTPAKPAPASGDAMREAVAWRLAADIMVALRQAQFPREHYAEAHDEFEALTLVPLLLSALPAPSIGEGK